MRTSKEIMQERAAQKKICDDLLEQVGSKNLRSAENKEKADQFDRAAADFDALDDELKLVIDHEERTRKESELERSMRTGDAKPDSAKLTGAAERAAYLKAFERQILGQKLSTEQEGLIRSAQLKLRSAELRGTDPQNTQDDTLGGYVVPTLFESEQVKIMQDFSGVMQVARLMPTVTGANILIPTSDQTQVKGSLIGEKVDDVINNFSLGQTSLGALIFTSNFVVVSKQLLRDNFISNFQGEVVNVLAERIARFAEEAFTKGATGVDGSITGILDAVTSAADTPALNTVITYDDLINLQHSVDSAYRKNGTYMFNDNMLKALRKLKDADGRPIWQMSTVVGAPSTIAGRPYVINTEMDDFGASKKAMLFGDWSKLRIRMVQDRELVIVREKYAQSRAIGFNMFQRMDSKLVDTKAIKALELPA